MQIERASVVELLGLDLNELVKSRQKGGRCLADTNT